MPLEPIMINPAVTPPRSKNDTQTLVQSITHRTIGNAFRELVQRDYESIRTAIWEQVGVDISEEAIRHSEYSHEFVDLVWLKIQEAKDQPQA